MNGKTNNPANKPRPPGKARAAKAPTAKASFTAAPATGTAAPTKETAEIMPVAIIVDDAAPAWPTPIGDATIDITTAPTTTAPATDEPATEAITPEAITPEAITPEAITPGDATPRRLPPALKLISPTSFLTPIMKEKIMATAFGTTNETVTETVKATVSQFNESAEAAMSSGKEAMEKITAQAKDAAENSMKSIEEMTDLARGNVEAMLAAARVAAAGFETLAAHISEVSRKSFESTTTAARAMTSAKTPNEMFQLQSDFAKTQFDVAVSEFSKMTEMMVKLSGEVMEPVQNRMATATDKMKTVFTK